MAPTFFLAVAFPLAPVLAVASLWYAVPLIVTVSLVCAATRHELMRPILEHALRFAVWVLVFMVAFMGLLAIFERLA
jgi:hypothetical protein